jgi:hypothetical protein
MTPVVHEPWCSFMCRRWTCPHRIPWAGEPHICNCGAMEKAVLAAEAAEKRAIDEADTMEYELDRGDA